MRVQQHVCDLCRGSIVGEQRARLLAPKAWARGDYHAPAEPASSAASSFERMFSFAVLSEPAHVELDVCVSCFAALFGAAAWLQSVMHKQDRG